MRTGLALLLKATEPESSNHGHKGIQDISSKEGEPTLQISEHPGIIKTVLMAVL